MIIAFAAGRNAVEIPIELLGAFHHRSVCLPDGSKYWLPSFSAKDIAVL